MALRELPTSPDRLVLEVDLPRLAPAEALDHWLRPQLLTRWWPPEARNDPRPGGWYELSWPKQGWHLRGRYTVLEPGKRMAFTWQWDHEPEQPLRHVEVSVTPGTGGGSVLTVTHAVYGEGCDEQQMRASHRDGWLHYLDRLASVGA